MCAVGCEYVNAKGARPYVIVKDLVKLCNGVVKPRIQ